MKIEKMRLEVEVMNKLDGKMYKVVSIENGIGTAKEMLEEGELGDKEVVITEKNALAFRLINDPAPYPAPTGYTVSDDGILLKKNVPVCEQGQLVLKEILATAPGMLIISSDAKEGEGLINLYAYEVAKDRFVKLLSRIPETIHVGYVGEEKDEAIFAFCKVNEEERTSEKGEKELVKVFGEAKIFSIKKGMICLSEEFDHPINIKEILVKERPDAKYELFVPSKEMVDDNDIVIAREETLWYRIKNGYAVELISMKTLQADWSYMYNEFIITGKDTLYIPSKDLKIVSPKVKELAGYPTLIDITKEEYAYKLTFSNENYEFKTLTSKSTKDRGYIITVE